ncbi:hypothetical protein KIF59_05525 [Enterobacter cloacae subsp. cloacae]|nr:hypothetical protein [Enterobacter cloacae subsp. cloacae]
MLYYAGAERRLRFAAALSPRLLPVLVAAVSTMCRGTPIPTLLTWTRVITGQRRGRASSPVS